MNTLIKTLCIAFLGAAVLFNAGCPKKPKRPSPDQTLQGPGSGELINPLGVSGDSVLTEKTSDSDRYKEENLERGVLPTVYFDFDKIGLNAAERKKLQDAAKWFTENPGRQVLLEGHCDWRGTSEYNLGLGDRRANSVKDYLKSLGIDIARLEILSKGDLDAKENASAAETAKDRRVELVIIKK